MVKRWMEEEPVSEWVERPVILNGGAYDEREAVAAFRIHDGDELLIDSFTVDGCVYRPAVVEAQIGKEAMHSLIEDVEDWWCDEGFDAWRYANA